MVKIATKIRAGCEKNIYVKTSKNIPLFSIDTSTDKIKSDFFRLYSLLYLYQLYRVEFSFQLYLLTWLWVVDAADAISEGALDFC